MLTMAVVKQTEVRADDYGYKGCIGGLSRSQQPDGKKGICPQCDKMVSLTKGGYTRKHGYDPQASTKEFEDRYQERKREHEKRTTGALKTDFKDWGQEGKHDHVTLQQTGTVPTSVIANMPGKMDERPGEHRNRHGQQWEDFKADIAAHGIQHPIFICADWNEKFYIYEGNHRRDAAVELGLPEVPVEVRYFGCADQQGTIMERNNGRPNFVANPVKKRRDGTIDPYA